MNHQECGPLLASPEEHRRYHETALEQLRGALLRYERKPWWIRLLTPRPRLGQAQVELAEALIEDIERMLKQSTE